MKLKRSLPSVPNATRQLCGILCLFILYGNSNAQEKIPLIKSTHGNAIIADGEHIRLNWKLSPELKPDVYYLNIPSIESKVSLKTNLDSISFDTKPGQKYDVMVLLHEKDTCHIQIASTHPPTTVAIHYDEKLPLSIPFSLVGSRVYFQGQLNGKAVNIQLDFGAGTNVINKMNSDKLDLNFSTTTWVDNTDGVHEERTSLNNELTIGNVGWTGIPVTEVNNMKPFEDMIIGNALFRDKIIELDYDRMQLTIHDKLPFKAKSYTKQPVFYEQSRPKFEAKFIHNNKSYKFWFLFDTGRNGTMLIGEDFTSRNLHWEELKELMIINERKIVRLDAIIAGQKIKDIVTNAANPEKPQGRPTLFGNQILNHFNAILDNTKGILYLKPNHRMQEPYSDYNSFLKEVAKMQKE